MAPRTAPGSAFEIDLRSSGQNSMKMIGRSCLTIVCAPSSARYSPPSMSSFIRLTRPITPRMASSGIVVTGSQSTPSAMASVLSR